LHRDDFKNRGSTLVQSKKWLLLIKMLARGAFSQVPFHRSALAVAGLFLFLIIAKYSGILP
jgi:hypothetical protein